MSAERSMFDEYSSIHAVPGSWSRRQRRRAQSRRLQIGGSACKLYFPGADFIIPLTSNQCALERVAV